MRKQKLDMDLKKNIEKYAELVLKKALNIKRGDKLDIVVSNDYISLVRELSKQAYKLGVVDINYRFVDEEMQKYFFKYAPDEALDQYPKIKSDYLESLCDEKYHRISIIGEDPEKFKEINQERLGRYLMTQGKALKNYMQNIMSNNIKWVVIACATPKWAKSLFPDLSEEEAMNKLWEKIFEATRVNQDDPLKAWDDHDKALKYYENFLNENKFIKYHYEAPGTDLEVYTAVDNVWVGGSAYSADEELFFANLPTEEIFTMPHAYKVNGVLRSTLPLFYNGVIIDDISLVFKDGRVVEYDAKVGKDALKQILEMDEGAKRLGEMALVENNSPISNTGILFKETLFDENASCHFALGKAYSENTNYQGELTDEAMKEIGMNDSIIHVDFMVGGPDLKITAYKEDGSPVVIMEKGNFII